MSELFQPGQHPDADQLSAFAEQALAAHEQEQMLAHLAHCASCREIAYLAGQAEFEELTASRPADAPARGLRKPRIPRWFSGWNLAWAAGAAIACLIVLAVQLHLFTARKSGETTSPIVSNLPPSRIAPEASQATQEQQQVTHRKNAPRSSSKTAASRPVGATEPVTTTLSTETVNSAILTGRNAAELVRAMPSPATSAGMSGASGNAAAVLKSAPASPPRGRTATVITGADAEVPVDTAQVSATLNNEMVASVASSQEPANLPSHLAAVSSVSSGRIALAIDAGGALFASKDAGKHWEAVSPQWMGRAVHVAFVTAKLPEVNTRLFTAKNRAAITSRAPAAATTAPAPAAKTQSETSKHVPPGDSTVSGIVTDQTGARIPGAEVTLIQIDSGERRDLRTDQNGSYAFDRLVPGTYELEVTAKGFSPGRQTGIDVSASQSEIANVALQVGAESAAVTVVSDAPALQTESNTVSTPIKEEPIAASPELFELTTDTGAVWTSSDGRHWKLK
jgi:hypothetical protein